MSELDLRRQKQALRKRMRALRDAAAPDQREIWSAAISTRALALPAYQTARVIHCYLPIRSEVDTRAIIEHALAHGKRVAIPLWQAHSEEMLCCEIESLDEEAYELDSFGLRVPRQKRWVNPAEIDIVFVPLLAFARTPPPRPSPAEYRRRGGSIPSPVVTGEESAAPLPGTPGEGWGEGQPRYMRLGYGAGFYDRFLRNMRALKVGLAFALQRVDELPQAETDTLLDDVITE